MAEQRSFGANDAGAVVAGLMCLALILVGALVSACQPIPQSYYDWLAAGGVYHDGYAPLFHGQSINECRFRSDHPRDCRIDAGRSGSSGIGAGGVTPFGHPPALSSSGHASGTTSASGERGGGMSGHAAMHGGVHASSGGGQGGGGHGGHGGR
jgi:hypothetical protein